jgi:hypothetical protein
LLLCTYMGKSEKFWAIFCGANLFRINRPWRGTDVSILGICYYVRLKSFWRFC